MQTEVIIVGGSFAGLSAALMLARARRDVVVVDGGLPRNRWASHAHGVLGLDGIAGAEMLKTARQQLLVYPSVRWLNGEAVDAGSGPDGIQVRLADDTLLTARKLLLATGIRDQLPDIPGLSERWGSTVLHCPYCHGYEIGGGAIGVLGGPEGTAEKAALLADWGDITFFSQGMAISDDASARLAARSVAVETTPVVSIEGEHAQWMEVVLADGRRVAQRALFAPAQQRMASPLVEQLGCRLTASPLGELIEVDAQKRTSVADVYAAGDATVVGNITLAMAEGVRAGAGIHFALVEEDGQPAATLI